MSSTQSNPIDLIQFSDNKNDHTDTKHDSDIVQKMVIGEPASATLIATAVAKLTTAATTASTIVINKSESESNESLVQTSKVTPVSGATLVTAPITETVPAATTIQATTTTIPTNSMTTNAVVTDVKNVTQVCILMTTTIL